MRKSFLKFNSINHLVLLTSVLVVLTFWGSAGTAIPPGSTALTGRVLDAISASQGRETPIVGATVSISGAGISTTTDSRGNFTLKKIPAGSQVIDIDTSSAKNAPDGSPYASFSGVISLDSGAVNRIERPFYLTRIDASGITTVDPKKMTVVENRNIGVSLTIPPNSAVNSDGTPYTGEIAISLIPKGFAPMAPPKELGFGMMVTIQPAGITFNQPIHITFPNIDNLPPGSKVRIMEPNINTGDFEAVGVGQIRGDRVAIETVEGGIAKTGNCTGPLPPGSGGGPPMPDPPPCPDCCSAPTGSITLLATGNLREEHNLVSYKSLNQDKSLKFIYNSIFADPRPIILNQVDLSPQTLSGGAYPDTVSMNLNVAGVNRGTVYTKVGYPNNLKRDGQMVQAIQIDATSMPTGVYPLDITVSTNYTSSTLSILQPGEVSIKNLSDSAFGSGWSINGLSRLYIQGDGSVLVDEGGGNLLHFKSKILNPPIASGAQFGTALRFDAASNPDYITFPSGAGNIMKTLPLTIEAWVRPEVRYDRPAPHSHVLNNVEIFYNVLQGHGFGVDIYGHNTNITINRNSGQKVSIISGVNIVPDTWYHIAIVYTNGNHQTYLNGELIDNSSYVQGNITAVNFPLYIGEVSDNCCLRPITLEFYKGAMDEVRVWNTARTQQEIQNNMSIQLSGNESGLVYYTKMDEGQGQVVTDSTGRGNNGTLGINANATANDPTWITYKIDGDFTAPAGDYSAIFKNADGTYTRKLKDGTQINFNAQGLQTSVIDRNGNTTTYQYDAQNRLISITDPVGLVTTLAYSGNRLSSVTDPSGRTTTFDYDGAGNLIKITDPDGTFRQFSYDSNHRMVSQTSKRGLVTTYQYNSAGRNIGAMRPDGSVVTVSPQWVLALIDPSTGVGTQSNPAPLLRLDQLVASYTNGNGKTTTYKLNEFGAITQFTDALGRITATPRDTNNNVTQSTDPRGNVMVMTYDGNGNLLTSKNQIGATTTFTYTTDGFNQIKTITDPKGGITTFNYDIKGNLTSILDALNNQTTMTYNSQGLLLTSRDALNNTTTFGYDTKGNLIGVKDPLLNETTFILDNAGNVTIRNDANGKATNFVYDSINRLIRVIDPDLANTDYTYDSAGNLISVRDFKGNINAFDYDALNRLIRRTDPLGNAETVTYDGAGNITSTTNRNGQIITFAYDAANQLTSKTLPGNQVTSFTYDNSGNRTAANDPDSKLSFTYDKANRLTSVATTGSPNQTGLVITYTYDLNGNRITMKDSPSTTTYSYVYDALNRVTSITNPASQTISFNYDSIGRRTKTTFPNGTTANFSYDAKSQLTNLINQIGTSNISTFGYTYDNVGNRVSMDTTRTGTSVTSPLSYIYDNLYRLARGTNPLPSQFDETFNYDPVGNRLRKTGQTTDSTFDSANRLIDDTQFTYMYDNNGNLIKKTNKSTSEITNYTYDAENHLTQVSKPGTTATYRYDGLGRRIEKNVNNVITRYIYDNEDIVLEYNGTQLTARYTHGAGFDEPLVMLRGVSYFYSTDGLGSIANLTDSAGSVVNSYVYNSFGQVVSQSGTLTNPYTYTGREYDSESGLYYYRARYYDASIGRFISEDPVGFSSRNLNLYTYVGNNPINVIDPLGLYGTNDCTYYKQRCKESGGSYYCETAQKYCNKFPKYPDPDPNRDDDFEGWSRCVRQCLQDCDRNQYNCEKNHPNPDPSTDSFFDLKPTSCHIQCYVTCGAWKIRHPFTP